MKNNPYDTHVWLQIASILPVPWASCRVCKIVGHICDAPGMSWTFSPPRRVFGPDMHYGTCVTHVSWCMPGSITSGFLWSRWRGKRSQHSMRMRNLQFRYLVRGPLMIILELVDWIIIISSRVSRGIKQWCNAIMLYWTQLFEKKNDRGKPPSAEM